ncbi:hypothetical protein MNBD_UNCLBAC01-871 [hydrothermal vent metagenome]|uniref:Molybdenum cofactor biosynthesis protein MoaD n=1 Tax=hydrothermal vent metagenome TaxID=652676 RepID=A0A3B1D2B3_9ZZZZ
MKKITIQYYAILREKRGVSEECIETELDTACALYEELKQKHNFLLSIESLKVSINEEFVDWKTVIHSGDIIVFIPPVAGG